MYVMHKLIKDVELIESNQLVAYIVTNCTSMYANLF